MYDTIINPYSGKSYKLTTKKGKNILFNYIKYSYQNGGKSKKSGNERSNPLAGSNPISQIYELYDNFEQFWDNSEEFFKLSKHFMNLGLRGYCYVNGDIVHKICSIGPNTHLCKFPSYVLKNICQ